LFVAKIPLEILSQELEYKFKQYGEIISSKIAVDSNFKSKGFGFITFSDTESAARALSESSKRTEIIGVKY
jgi:RNA recognition motif-containing protein